MYSSILAEGRLILPRVPRDLVVRLVIEGPSVDLGLANAFGYFSFVPWACQGSLARGLIVGLRNRVP